MSFPVRVFPDGTKCYSGPSCKKHASKMGERITSVEEIFYKFEEFDRNQLDEVQSRPTYMIPIENLDDALAVVDKANAKLEKEGVEERFGYYVESSVVNEGGQQVEYARLIISDPVLRVNGWGFVAAHEFTPDGKATSYMFDKDTESDAREITNTCDRCGQKRHRERVYWLKNEEGEIKQVGKNCLQPFLKISPSGLWALEKNALNFARFTGGGKNGSVVYDVREALGAGFAAAAKSGGFVTRSEATTMHPATADVVSDQWHSYASTVKDDAAIKAQVEDILAWSEQMAGDNQYASNLKAVLAEPWVKKRHLPLALSAIRSYEKDKERREAIETRKRETATLKNEPFAEIGSKIAGVKATVKRKTSYPSTYGDVTVWILHTEDGHVLKWNASSWNDFEPGDEVSIKTASVKDHSEFNGMKQTVLTRAKLEPVAQLVEA